jgi:hypothetical protein
MKLLPASAAIEGIDDIYGISLASRRKPHKRLFPLSTGRVLTSVKEL